MKAIIDLNELKKILSTYYNINFIIEDRAIYIDQRNGYIVGYFTQGSKKEHALSGYSEPGLIRDKFFKGR